MLIITVVVAPWNLGSTTVLGGDLLVVLSSISGLLWLIKLLARVSVLDRVDLCKNPSGWNWNTWVCLASIAIFLFYVMLSAVNPSSQLTYTYYPGSPYAGGVEIEYLNSISALPSSSDSRLTFRALKKYFSMAVFFFALRDWILTESSILKNRIGESDQQLPKRISILVWTLSLSAAAMAFVGILQRLDGTDRLLWLVENHYNDGRGAFGPFPYRSSAAQYLNLMWPVILGFWMMLDKVSIYQKGNNEKYGARPHILLIPIVTIIGIGVLMCNSRGGIFVLLLLLVSNIFAGVVFFDKSRKRALALLAVFISIAASGWFLGKNIIVERFVNEDLMQLSGRKLIYDDCSRMVDDFWLFGSGAETFAPLYYFYKKSNPGWSAYAHNDYLETLITFGVVGLVMILVILVSIILLPFFGNGVPASKCFIVSILTSICGVMLHARYDLPFQVYGVHFEFVVICSLLSCLKWPRFRYG